MKLDRLVAHLASVGGRTAHALIAAGRVRVDGAVVTRNQHETDRFMRVDLDGDTLRAATRAHYFMLHKPAGILSATSDAGHRTVLDLIGHPDRDTLHLAGRLDRSSTGLVLLTNDGRWSKRVTDAALGIAKVYRVETLEAIAADAVEAFARGFHFARENIRTLPAGLEILGECEARVTLHEGRHHQLKRMFHFVNNRVTRLHREGIGGLFLPDDLAPGRWRALTPAERAAIFAAVPSAKE
jgi:16S rRNA pseudouridine516 synthase